MNVSGSAVVITGAGSGIGAAMARAFAAAGAEQVVVADLNGEAAGAVAREIGGVAEELDVADAPAVDRLVARTVARLGRIDVFCANAGVASETGLDSSDEAWRRAFDVNVMGHVYAARAVIPPMVERGSGYFVATASAAGLLVNPGDAPYTASKHAAVGFAEWLAVTYGGSGIGFSVVCPMGVATPMLLEALRDGVPAARAVADSGGIITPDHVAQAVLAGIADERFLILPHPEVATYWMRKAADPERWLSGMRRLSARSAGS
ncbi:MAG TPA: SDR family oxidoreductase [Trebonia sp.]|nr:SDR family oxidoreductase [Trebonia sp.]